MGTALRLSYKFILFYLLVTDASADVGTALFQSGKEYVYGYSSSLIAGSKDYVSFASAINFTGELHIQGGASVLNVQLNNAQVSFSDGEFHMTPFQKNRKKRSVNGQTNKTQKQLKLQLKNIQDIEGIRMQFSYINGKVEKLRISEGYPTWSANILRGVASFLGTGDVNRQGVFLESDINGDCPTTYSTHGDKISKTKDLLRCTGRPETNSTSLSAILSCSNTFLEGLLQSGECTENHLIELMPTFPVNVTIITTLKRLNATKARLEGRIANLLPSSLTYDAGVSNRNLNEHKLIQRRSISNSGIANLKQNIFQRQGPNTPNALFASGSPSRCGSLNFTVDSGFLQSSSSDQLFLLNVGVCSNFEDIEISLGQTPKMNGIDSLGIARDSLSVPTSTAFLKWDDSGTPQKVPIIDSMQFLHEQSEIPTSSGMPITITIEGISSLSLQVYSERNKGINLVRQNMGKTASILPITSTVLRSDILVGSGPLKSGIGFEQTTLTSAGAKGFLVKADGAVETMPELSQGKIDYPSVENKVFAIEETKKCTKRLNIKKLVR